MTEMTCSSSSPSQVAETVSYTVVTDSGLKVLNAAEQMKSTGTPIIEHAPLLLLRCAR
jgi:hypothetical protein